MAFPQPGQVPAHLEDRLEPMTGAASAIAEGVQPGLELRAGERFEP